MPEPLTTKVKRRLGEYRARTHRWLVEQGYAPHHTDYQPFVVVCNIRTGSTMLRSFLDDHPAVRMFFELFHLHPDRVPFDVPGYEGKSEDAAVVHRRNTDPVGFLQSDVFTAYPPSVQAVGFKLLYTQARTRHMWWEDPPYERWWTHVDRAVDWKQAESDVWDYLEDRTDVAVIHLTRENLLKQKVSGALAKTSGRWGIGATGGIGDPDAAPTVTLNPTHCRQDFEATRRMQHDIDARFERHRTLEVTYEQLVEQRNETLSRVQEFIGVAVQPLETETRKQRKRPLHDVIDNYDALRSELADTPWASFFDE